MKHDILLRWQLFDDLPTLTHQRIIKLNTQLTEILEKLSINNPAPLAKGTKIVLTIAVSKGRDFNYDVYLLIEEIYISLDERKGLCAEYAVLVSI